MKRKTPMSCKQNQRVKALAELTHLTTSIQARNQDLTPEMAEELADRFTREVIQEMITEGKIEVVQS